MMYVFIFGISIGVIIGVVIAVIIFTLNAEEYRRFITETSIDTFVDKLRAKVNRQAFPWEENIIFESDIDEVLKEMGCENKW